MPQMQIEPCLKFKVTYYQLDSQATRAHGTEPCELAGCHAETQLKCGVDAKQGVGAFCDQRLQFF